MPDFKTYSIKRVIRLRNRLRNETAIPYYSCTVEGADFNQFVRSFHRALPSGIPLDTKYESMRYLAGVELSADRINDLSWRLAGNTDLLKEGVPVRPWTTQHSEEWVPLQILKAIPRRNTGERFGCMFCFQVLAGTSCPLQVYRFWGNDACYAISQHIGFTPHWLSYPYKHPAHLVGMRFYALVEPNLCREHPGFFRVESTPSFEAHNKAILKYRVKQPHAAHCPRGFEHECHKCIIGYTSCPGGTHKEDYVEGVCPNCGPDQWFDPEAGSDLCVACSYSHT